MSPFSGSSWHVEDFEANKSRGTHSRDHLSSLIADHYKQEDAGFQLWTAAAL